MQPTNAPTLNRGATVLVGCKAARNCLTGRNSGGKIHSTDLWRCRGPGGSHRLQNGWGVARRGPWWVRLPYASASLQTQFCYAPPRITLERFLLGEGWYSRCEKRICCTIPLPFCVAKPRDAGQEQRNVPRIRDILG